MENTRNLVRLLLVDGDFVLLAKVLKKGFYFLPGGGIEYNEPVLEASKRELAEEIGIERERVKFVQPIGVYENSWDDNGSPFHEVNFVCKCAVDGFASDLPVASAEAHLAFEWVALSALGNIDLRPQDFRRLIPIWCSSPDKGFFSSNMISMS